ncbi:unnamed protein product [Paramecium primaurelia]|uniref:Transmembrane protein n=1 Tax=Paramecium primaurelia TaxID=5886 RepID=A0A8S1Q7H3_PARPR|nr:unnamed protein product [Paramecium primaurelia]
MINNILIINHLFNIQTIFIINKPQISKHYYINNYAIFIYLKLRITYKLIVFYFSCEKDFLNRLYLRRCIITIQIEFSHQMDIWICSTRIYNISIYITFLYVQLCSFQEGQSQQNLIQMINWKPIQIIILIYFETDIFLKASLLGLFLLIYQFLSQHFKPYILQRFNILDIQAGQLSCGAIFLAAVKYICEYQENYLISGVIQTIIILISLILSYPFVQNIPKVYYKKFKPQILSSLLSIFLAAQPNSKYIKQLSTNLTLIRYRIKFKYITVKRRECQKQFFKIKKSFFKKEVQ